MYKFLKKLFLFIFVPVFCLTASYLYFDPFKVVKEYKNYSYLTSINKDFLSTEMYLKNKDRYKYNSFIFGSSRTMAYHPEHWKAHLAAGSSPYVFDAAAESIYGIYKKLIYLDSTDVEIKNVLIIICNDFTFLSDKDSKAYLFIKHPLISGNGKVNFHSTFVKSYLNPNFFISFYFHKIFGKTYGFMKDYVDSKPVVYDSITNKVSFPTIERELRESPDNYYESRASIFYKQKGETIDLNNKINENQKMMLKKIATILQKHHTNYRVVISPLYNQIKFSVKDFAILKETFGSNLYDFSGFNSFTKVQRNYYEISHYKENVGDSILNIIYQAN